MNIKQIPLIKEVVDDQIMWMYASDGNYTVKTGYKAISQWNDSRQDGPSNRDIFSKVLNKVWSLNTIPINKSHARNNNDRRSSNHIITQKWNRPIPNIIKANSDANLSDEGRWGLSRRLLFHAGGV
ncbi:hypothetical protein QL285_043330 [Trifolium repens]|jgi:hypothetical protein|nr:hypothetical protein QL285_043330 [Trifolium repens]